MNKSEKQLFRSLLNLYIQEPEKMKDHIIETIYTIVLHSTGCDDYTKELVSNQYYLLHLIKEIREKGDDGLLLTDTQKQ